MFLARDERADSAVIVTSAEGGPADGGRLNSAKFKRT